MFAIGFDGVQGKISVPLEGALGLYKQAAVWNPGGMTQPMWITTNGKFDLQANDPAKLLVATARMPTINCFRDEDFKKVHDVLVKPINELADKLIMDKIVIGNDDVTVQKQEKGISKGDVAIETVNRIPEDRPIIFRDRRRMVIGFDRLWKAAREDEIQWEIQDRLSMVRATPTMKPIGYGFMEGNSGEDWHLVRRPNRYIKVGPRTVVRVDQTELDISNNESRVQASYMYLAACALREFCKIGEAPMHMDQKNYNIHDYVAYCNLILAGIAGYGDTPTTKHWTSTDIQTTIDHMLGYGYSMANRYQWGSDKALETWIAYYKWCLFMAYAIARVKAPTMDYEVLKYINQDRLVTERFTRVNHGHFSGFGGFGNLVMLIPRNDMTWKGNTVFPFPVVVDTKGISDERKALQQANDYEMLREKKNVSWSTVRVERGEIPPNTIDHESTAQKWLLLDPTSDGRIVEMNLPLRDTIEYTFDRSNVVVNGLDEKTRRALFMIGNLTNSGRVLTEGYITDVSLKLMEPVEVTYFKTSFDEMAVKKKDTATVTDTSKKVVQIQKDSAGLAGPIESKMGEKAKRADIAPPPNQEEVPEKKHLEETPEQEVKNESAEKVNNESDSSNETK
jgi:hypothetical protein